MNLNVARFLFDNLTFYRLREENELLMSQYLSKVRQLENDKSDQSSQYQRRLEEFQRDKDQDIDRLKSIHRCWIIKHYIDKSHNYRDRN